MVVGLSNELPASETEPEVMVSFSPCFAGSVHPHRKAACISSWLIPHSGKQHFSHLSTVQHQSSRQQSIHHRNHRRATYSWKGNRSTPRVLRSPMLQQLQGKVIAGNESQRPKGSMKMRSRVPASFGHPPTGWQRNLHLPVWFETPRYTSASAASSLRLSCHKKTSTRAHTHTKT